MRVALGVDPAIAEEAAILTAIGIGTAFVVLLLLLIVILLIGVLNRRISGEVVPAPQLESDSQPDEDHADVRDRALAAALAVTALRASRPQTSLTTGEDG